MTRLLVNIDHIATLRNARKETFPDPVAAAIECEAAGAQGIVFHLREDRRHITDDDVARLKETVKGKLDFELSLAPEILSICEQTRPDLATLVPERREEVTTEGGLDVLDRPDDIKSAVHRLRNAGIPEVALFMDPDPAQIEAVLATGATAIELHTGAFANAVDETARLRFLEQLGTAARMAHEAGLRVHAGHGLDYSNWPLFAQHVPHVQEVSIGFAIISRALFTGLRQAVADMRRIIQHPAS